MEKKLSLVDQVKLPNDVSFRDTSMINGNINGQPNKSAKGVHFFVNSKFECQLIEGIGGAFSELGGKAFLSLPEDKQDSLAQDLFKDSLTFFRVPVGASDFAINAYSFNDYKDDFEMEHFSIDRDQKYLIPYMKACLDMCPDMKLHASPWSPPAWMKENQSMAGGSFIDNELYYKAYAKYVSRYIKAYADEGFHITRYAIQNEPDVTVPYPSCCMSVEQMGMIIEYINEEFKANNIDTELWAGTFRGINEATACDFLTSCPKATEIIRGIGCQYTTIQPLYDILKGYPKLSIMHTESNCFNGSNTWNQAVILYLNILEYYQAGCDTFTYWNMVLNEEGKSSWGWKQNSLITINETTKEIIYNPDFYIMKLVSKCTTPGSKRVHCTSKNKRGIAVKKPDGTLGILISNFCDAKNEGDIVIDGMSYPVSLDSFSIYYFELE